MKKVIDFLDRTPVTKFLSSICLIAMALIMTMNVILRYCFNFSFNWGDEILRYLCVYMTFLGTAAAFNGSTHIGIYVFVENVVPKAARKYFRLAADILTLVFLSLATYYGIIMVKKVLASVQVSPALHVPMQFIYGVIPVCAILSIIQVLIQIFRHKTYLNVRE